MRFLFTTVPVIFLIFFTIGCQSEDSEPAIKVVQDIDGVSIYSNQKEVLRYHLSTQFPADSLPSYYQRSGFIHPLTTPKGKILTDDFPEGHLHQHGLFFALVNTTFRGEFTDFWNQQKETGTVRAKAIVSLRENGFNSLQEHLALQNGDTIVAMEERWEVSVSASGPFMVFDLSSHLYMAGNDSLIVNPYHYGGLGFRGNAEWNDLDFEPDEQESVNFIGKNGKAGFRTSEGKERIEGNHSRPEWLAYYGKAENDSIGMAILGHPDNFRHPQTVRLHPSMPYFSLSPMATDSFVLHPGDTLLSRYRILTFDGTPDFAQIEAEWERYRRQGQPNIVLIMADDLGYETLVCNGGTSYQTPHLDQMAAEGMRFTHCFSNPLCTPSRVQLMTGKYNDRNYFAFGQLDSTQLTFADYLKEEGYRTAIAGKWQLFGNQRQREISGRLGSLPPQAGFEQYCLWQVREKTGPRYKDPHLNINGEEQILTNQYGPKVFVEFLQEFIDQTDHRPFLAYFPMALTHDPFRPTPDNLSDYGVDSLHRKNDPRFFADNVAYMDKMLGELLDHIRESEEASNTLVLFIGDNGTDRKVVSEWQGEKIKGRKGYPERDGTHVPMIAWWPGRIQAGQLNENLIDFSDFLPSLLEAAHISTPKDPELDGLSFYAQLVQKEYKTRDYIYCDYAPRWGKFENARWVQDHQWKLYDDGRFYNIQQDPLEEEDLQKTEAGVEKRLHFAEILAKRAELIRQSSHH